MELLASVIDAIEIYLHILRFQFDFTINKFLIFVTVISDDDI